MLNRKRIITGIATLTALSLMLAVLGAAQAFSGETFHEDFSEQQVNVETILTLYNDNPAPEVGPCIKATYNANLTQVRDEGFPGFKEEYLAMWGYGSRMVKGYIGDGQFMGANGLVYCAPIEIDYNNVDADFDVEMQNRGHLRVFFGEGANVRLWRQHNGILTMDLSHPNFGQQSMEVPDLRGVLTVRQYPDGTLLAQFDPDDGTVYQLHGDRGSYSNSKVDGIRFEQGGVTGVSAKVYSIHVEQLSE